MATTHSAQLQAFMMPDRFPSLRLVNVTKGSLVKRTSESDILNHDLPRNVAEGAKFRAAMPTTDPDGEIPRPSDPCTRSSLKNRLQTVESHAFACNPGPGPLMICCKVSNALLILQAIWQPVFDCQEAL
jgi:hypothetical protein